jgi:hypothetical protein
MERGVCDCIGYGGRIAGRGGFGGFFGVLAGMFGGENEEGKKELPLEGKPKGSINF